MNLILQDKNIYRNFVFILANISVFLFFALLLPTKSGHSIAIIAGLTACILSIPLWKENKTTKEIKITCFFFLFLALFWSHTFDGIFSFSTQGDHFLRYFLGIFFIIGFSRITIHPRFIMYGLAIGSIASGILALYQYKTIGRAEGFTNAIRFGNLAMLMGLICFIAALFDFFRKTERCFFVAASGFALLASILSLSRGGWLILIAIPFLAFFIFQENKKLIILFIATFIPIIFIFSHLPPVEARIQEAKEQITGYFNQHEKYVDSSLGARLEQWKTAFSMGIEKPFTGWGDKNIKAGKLEYIERGIADPSIMNYPHAHNDFLEAWARRGMIGVVSLLAIYLAPILLIIASYKKTKSMISDSKNLNAINKILLLSGVLIYFGYFIFGLSDVFFTFVIGHNFYLFSLIFILSSMQWIQKANSK